MSQMCAFVNDTNADVDMAYDWVCEMLDISSFVDNNTAWDSFYETWESCENRNDLNTFQIVWLINTNMQETKFLLHGQFHRANGSDYERLSELHQSNRTRGNRYM